MQNVNRDLGQNRSQKISEKNYMSDKIEAFGFIRLVTPQCLSGADTGLETVRGCNKGLKLR